ncbi:MAG TPA: LysR family transcriptional regulator [Candidatus Acidoferrum sp.]|nr:LysR family transcriptional regulator [Candidatus Acidoferrum sp.]
MNIHYLELFYFVAKHGGIAGAVRNIPYGIQQPAVSGQIAKLEESLGTKLFQRRPFALSPTGMELFEFIRPFFDNIDIVAERLRQSSSPQLRIAAPAIVLHDICRKCCNAFAQNSRRSGFICTRRRALMLNDCFWLAMSTLPLCSSTKNRAPGFRCDRYWSCR